MHELAITNNEARHQVIQSFHLNGSQAGKVRYVYAIISHSSIFFSKNPGRWLKYIAQRRTETSGSNGKWLYTANHWLICGPYILLERCIYNILQFLLHKQTRRLSTLQIGHVNVKSCLLVISDINLSACSTLDWVLDSQSELTECCILTGGILHPNTYHLQSTHCVISRLRNYATCVYYSLTVSAPNQNLSNSK